MVEVGGGWRGSRKKPRSKRRGKSKMVGGSLRAGDGFSCVDVVKLSSTEGDHYSNWTCSK